LDVNGVGYEVNISLNTYTAIQKLTEGKLFIHLQVKEDAHILFGFLTKQKRIHVPVINKRFWNVGAATARMMLSSMKPDEVQCGNHPGQRKIDWKASKE
jgi:Holliday junction DNA helicase RuvA